MLLAGAVAAQDNDVYVDDNQLRYEDYTYQPNIKTVQLYESSWESSLPLIEFNSAQQLLLSFDDLDLNRKIYTMTIVHCDYKWNPSDLMISEYLSGFYDLNLLNFQYSVNTLQKYTHYSILFPTPSMQLLRSGNYIVYVYQDGNKNKLVLSKRFMVFDNKVTVSTTVRQPVGGDNQYTGQHIDFNIMNPGYDILNPYTDLKVVLTQNNRWDNAVYEIKPTFLAPGQLTYSLDDASTFKGGNEFRYFDTRSLRTYTERINNIYKDSASHYNIDLTNDASRANKNYLFYNDLNGGFLIKNQDADINATGQSSGDPTIEADYAYVHFYLPYDNPVTGGNIYVLGKLTNWKLDKANRMNYNYKHFAYECTLYLKQGYYNYIYAYLPDKSRAGDESMFEGSHWDTENDYTIYVYYRARATYYDQLICVKKFNSLKR